MRTGLTAVVAVAALAATIGVLGSTSLWMESCRGPERAVPPEGPSSPPAIVCGLAAWRPGQTCTGPAPIEEELASAEIEVLDAHVTAQGHSLPQRLRLRVERPTGAVVYHAKWKQAPPEGDASNNSPRRELAAVRLQPLLLDPERFVVPPTAARCLPLDDPRVRVHGASAFGASRCALGVLAFWLPNVRELGEADLARAAVDRSLAAALGDLNTVTYLAEHRDGIGQNFLLGESGDRKRTFAVDNGMTFGAWRYHPMRLLSSSWCSLHVRAVRADLVDRLRALRRPALDALAVVAQLELDEHGIYRNVPRGPALAGQQELGVRHSGKTLQLGLTTTEIDDVYERVGELLADIDTGHITLLP